MGPYNKTTKNLAVAVLMIISLSFSSFAHYEDPKEAKKVSVVVNVLKPGFATLTWSDYSITAIQINSVSGAFMPTIPVMNATSLHLNDLINGFYEINFLAGDKVVASEKLVVS
jgi:uncharacterized protein with PQ loop repeat